MNWSAILGGSLSVWDDLAETKRIIGGRPERIIAINDAASHYRGRVDVMVTLHPEHLDRWLVARAKRGLAPPRAIASHQKRKQVSIILPARPNGVASSGSSGLFACRVAMHLGIERAVLCGVPMDPGGRHFFGGGDWTAAKTFRKAWEAMLPELCYKFRSAGGWTRELLGPPSRDWLSQPPSARPEDAPAGGIGTGEIKQCQNSN